MNFFDLKIDDAKELARLHGSFCRDIENSRLLVDFNEDVQRLEYSDLFWYLWYTLHFSEHVDDQMHHDYLWKFADSILEELKRRSFLTFIMFSDDLPEIS